MNIPLSGPAVLTLRGRRGSVACARSKREQRRDFRVHRDLCITSETPPDSTLQAVGRTRSAFRPSGGLLTFPAKEDLCGAHTVEADEGGGAPRRQLSPHGPLPIDDVAGVGDRIADAHHEPSKHEGYTVRHVESRGAQLHRREKVAHVHERGGQLADAAHEAERVAVAALQVGSGFGSGFDQ
eukprot:scaffold27802_cov38-Phaeocystis_antarctica.AAC.1